MSKKRKIDFVLKENEYEKIIFRFYPRQSHCHSHYEDIPPSKWDEVYKVYYSYSIFKVYKDDNEHKVLYQCSCDECSIIDEIAALCKYLSEGKRKVTNTYQDRSWDVKLLNNEFFPMGYGTSWTVRESRDKKSYKFELFRWDEVGYRFWLSKKRIKEFGEYLQECCEYMLAHGEGI